ASVTGGLLWVTGAGGSHFFETATSTTFVTPPDMTGTLVKNGDNTYTYTEKDQVLTYFDTSGYISKIVDADSLPTTFGYNVNHRLTSITDPSGSIVTFTYNVSGKIDSITMPGSRTVTVTRDVNNEIQNLQNPDGGLRSFTYDSSYRLTSDRFGPYTG